MTTPEVEDIESLTQFGQKLIECILEEEPIDTIKHLIDAGAPLWYQDEDEGITALHAAAYMDNYEVAKLLLDEGAIWNAVDNLKITAAEIALSMNNANLYTLIRDTGIRSELLLTLLPKQSLPDSASSLILRARDITAAGSSDAFMSSRLRYTTSTNGQEICMLQVGDQEVGVMMGWERGIMQETVRALCLDHPHFQNGTGLKVLNVGFGLGIIDSFFQNLSPPPTRHVIIEPHIDVLQHMKELGWYEKPGVTVLEGKWQDFVANESLLEGGFDIVYTDTFSEDYLELQRFFQALPNLLAGSDSRFGFFNGLGATNVLFYDVYTHLAELHLAGVGIDVEWTDVDVAGEDDTDRWGESREYFSVPLYRLPIGKVTRIA